MLKLSVSRIFAEYKARRGQTRSYRKRQEPDHGESCEESNSSHETYEELKTYV